MEGERGGRREAACAAGFSSRRGTASSNPSLSPNNGGTRRSRSVDAAMRSSNPSSLSPNNDRRSTSTCVNGSFRSSNPPSLYLHNDERSRSRSVDGTIRSSNPYSWSLHNDGRSRSRSRSRTVDYTIRSSNPSILYIPIVDMEEERRGRPEATCAAECSSRRGGTSSNPSLSPNNGGTSRGMRVDVTIRSSNPSSLWPNNDRRNRSRNMDGAFRSSNPSSSYIDNDGRSRSRIVDGTIRSSNPSSSSIHHRRSRSVDSTTRNSNPSSSPHYHGRSGSSTRGVDGIRNSNPSFNNNNEGIWNSIRVLAGRIIRSNASSLSPNNDLNDDESIWNSIRVLDGGIISSNSFNLSSNNDLNDGESIWNGIRVVDGRIISSNSSYLSPNNDGSRNSVNGAIRMPNPSLLFRDNDRSILSTILDLANVFRSDVRIDGQLIRPAERAAVQQLRSIIISEDFISNGSNSICSICRDEYQLGEEAREMPCGHMYHQTCIFTWLETQHTCPTCRFKMPCVF